MVESRLQLKSTDILQNFITQENVGLDTSIPPLPSPDKLLKPPDFKEHEQNIGKINASIKRIKGELVLIKNIVE